MKKIVIIIVLIISLTLIVGCDYQNEYRENNSELQVVARNSLLGVQGHESDFIKILEIDNFGRTLFCYTSNAPAISQDYKLIAILISQKTDKNHSYFFDGINYLVSFLEDDSFISKPTDDNIYSIFSQKQIDQLKLYNDWNKEINLNNLFEVDITRRKDDILDRASIDKIAREINIDFTAPFYNYLTTDSNGNFIYFLRSNYYDEKLRIYYYYDSYIVYFDKNKNYEIDKIEKIDDIYNYQNQLYDFKLNNGWDFFKNS